MPNRTELTDKLQRVRGMVEYVRENLDGDEYEAFLDMVAPLPEVEQVTTGKKPQKKSTKKSGGKSSRASGMAAALNKSLRQQREAAKSTTDESDHWPCAYKYPDGLACSALPDANVHHLQTADGYHPFHPAASNANEGSSVNGATPDSIVNSVTNRDDAGNAARVAAGE